MTNDLSFTDRLRIERAVWTLDGRLQDLPHKSRVAKRRELRANLRAAALEVGAAQAVRQLGDMRRLSAEYLVAEYGQWAPRPSWLAGFGFLVLGQVVMAVLLDTGKSAFRSGVVAADPDATGTFVWDGIPYLLQQVTFTFADGRATPPGGDFGGAWTPLVYLCYLAGAVLAGRLWRLLPAWRRTHGDLTGDL